jgi:hypothetical protein
VLLPAGAAFAPLTTILAALARTIEFRPLEFRSVLTSLARAVEPRPVEIARTVARRARTALRPILLGPALLPRPGFAARRTITKILPRAAMSPPNFRSGRSPLRGGRSPNVRSPDFRSP